MMNDLTRPPVLFTGALIIIWYLKRHFRRSQDNPHGLPLPPGPQGYPIIGNLFDLPTWKPWLVYNELFKIYGDMVYMNVLGQGFLVLGSSKRTYDLFEKRSSNYSDRAQVPMMDLMGYDYNVGLFPYGPWWRYHRRIFHDFLHPNIVGSHEPTQTAASRTLLRNILRSPEDFLDLIRLSFASTIMRIVYGVDVKDIHDPYIKNVEKAMHGLSDAGTPGNYLVNLLPAMRHIPSWFPGAGWKRMAKSFQAINREVAFTPFERVKERMALGEASTSVAATLIERLSDFEPVKKEEEETVYRNTCALAYFAGADTTVSSVQSFFMAMCLYPDIQKRAQAELDAVLKGRLPEFTDRPVLPYINALVKETLRWQPVTPLAVPHMATNADTYNGFFIPKGTIVFGNTWSILHNPETYKNPEEYNPERFLKDGKLASGVVEPASAAFGFGRRICVGRFLSDSSLFSTIAHVLSVYDIKPGLDGDGKEVKFKPDVTPGIVSYPVPFSCRIIPRSSAAENLIRDSQAAE
ncbi:hypothetical protein D9756_007313 [Leucocoprinus leucothites]|uniref:Cytochrome P450 n=1 Tax=Leucocoprinus leucothites TaxID=201217 RepID=A0A8H5D5T7_9AGAR|nr:hypothetical protein D9756_007313 [Leucoagaricus leucothites]